METLNKVAVLRLPLPPIAEGPLAPTEEDAKNTQQLSEFLAVHAPPVSEEKAAQQRMVLETLHGLFKNWCQQPFHMFVSGSYRIGVHSEHADIDVLFVTTSAISRQRVFSEFVPILQTTEHASDVQPIPNARVPIIGLRLMDQEFDILTCHLRVPILPRRQDLLLSYEWMNGLDDACILAFNGPRVTELILKSVPELVPFCAALKFLRHWAKTRFVYSNKSGFLGGINFALLLMYIAQRHPFASAARLILLFFQTFAAWKWSRARPLQLDEHLSHTCPVWLQSFEWTPRQMEVMVILTPCFPRFNTSFSASQFTTNILHKEFQRAADFLSGGCSGGCSRATLEQVCSPPEVLSSCQRFIEISIHTARTLAGKSWAGYVEAQSRFLVEYMSREELAIEEFRSLPIWIETPGIAALVKKMYVTAQDDGKIRTYLVRGTLEQPVTYFLEKHADNGPDRPLHSTIAARFCARTELPPELAAYFTSQIEAPAPKSVEADALHSADANRSPKRRKTAAAPFAPPPPRAKSVNPWPRPWTWTLQEDLPILPTLQIVRPLIAAGVPAVSYDTYIGKECTWAGKYFPASPDFSIPSSCLQSTPEATWLAFQEYADKKLETCPQWAAAIERLRGQTLACWCVGKNTATCHGQWFSQYLASSGKKNT
jgi:poly(A) polymerase